MLSGCGRLVLSGCGRLDLVLCCLDVVGILSDRALWVCSAYICRHGRHNLLSCFLDVMEMIRNFPF